MVLQTHEPAVPVNWPDGHVSVARDSTPSDARDRLRLGDIRVALTGADDLECVMVSMGECQHFLHSTTARALADKLAANVGRAVTITIHNTEHSAGRNAAHALEESLKRRLSEWNRIHEGTPGWAQV